MVRADKKSSQSCLSCYPRSSFSLNRRDLLTHRSDFLMIVFELSYSLSSLSSSLVCSSRWFCQIHRTGLCVYCISNLFTFCTGYNDNNRRKICPKYHHLRKNIWHFPLYFSVLFFHWYANFYWIGIIMSIKWYIPILPIVDFSVLPNATYLTKSTSDSNLCLLLFPFDGTQGFPGTLGI